jgi:hypothetical protein
MAISVAPLTTAVLNAVDPRFAGAASGINNAASRVSALIAIAVFGLVMTPIFNRALDAELRRAALPSAAVAAIDQQRSRVAAIELPADLDSAAKNTAEMTISHAFVAGFRAIMLISAVLAVGAAASAWLWIREQPQPSAVPDPVSQAVPRR